MKALLVYPEFPLTFWSFKHGLRFTNRKAMFPPLGLATVASMLPKEWEKKLVDLNIEPLEDKYLQWANYVFISAMDMQRSSAIKIINRCKELGIKVVAGGPFFTENYEDFENVDHLVIGEAEATLSPFLEDLENGTPKHLYMADKWPDLGETPPPMWELVDLKKYYDTTIQFSRGCPFDCEFCQITRLFGRKVRTKSKEQIIEELEKLYDLGWRENVFFVDDNLIGNKYKLKTEILPAIIEWMEKKGHPFGFLTQASVNLADDEELMRTMVRAGFNRVFIGIENPDEDCLAETGKFQNTRRDLIANVKKMQQLGLEVWSGFIIGFDNEKESIFDRMPQFIQESGIPIATMGLLTAMKGTRLYKRLEEENRLISDAIMNNDEYRTNLISTDYAINFIPKMKKETLLDGYRKILKDIYSPEPYYQRLITFLREFNPPKNKGTRLSYEAVKRLIKATVVLGVLDKGRVQYWKLFFWTLLRCPEFFALALARWSLGYHFRKIFEI